MRQNCSALQKKLSLKQRKNCYDLHDVRKGRFSISFFLCLKNKKFRMNYEHSVKNMKPSLPQEKIVATLSKSNCFLIIFIHRTVSFDRRSGPLGTIAILIYLIQ